MEITDKSFFMKYNDAIGRKLRPMTAGFEEKFGNLSDDENEDVFRQLAWWLWEMEKKTASKDVGEDEIVRGILAYQTAFQKELTELNFHEAVYYLSEILKGPNKKTLTVAYRRVPVAIFNERGRRIYKPPEPEYVEALMTALFQQIRRLIREEMSLSEIFYHASLIHLKMYLIHPFVKNNIKAAILLEKWFLAEKLGKVYIKLPSEKYYAQNKGLYNTNTLIGTMYNNVDDKRISPFLLMLPDSLKINDISIESE
ncbi:Fic family protein [Methanimicrococcus blatticola]|uniref:Fic/DOC family protein n=1 Tax=Methanimicrococcus blatticola TaxID=91560 RepID=A0A484F522_9EURY|nr:Fic family protein [Methanimicrococcus blatticola]MBZ3936286.1 Fic family protein [Methanimicrococcus blatticola]MCC2508289.1 Fic family protein [Methanimicrococcus blatticola]TDQ70256.1 Fic/DOC family protein [Methanimicrococcus blatticola]